MGNINGFGWNWMSVLTVTYLYTSVTVIQNKGTIIKIKWKIDNRNPKDTIIIFTN